MVLTKSYTTVWISMTVPGELNYWITDRCGADSAEELANARIDQVLERISDALPGRIDLLDQFDEREARLVLLMVARHCHNEVLKGKDAQRALQVFTERQVRRGFVEYSTLNQFESQIKEIANLQDQRDQAKRLKQAHDLAGIKQLSLAEAAQ